MADPLSIASGIAGLITLADVIIERTYRNILACKNAGKDASRLLDEVQSFLGILKGLQVLELQVSKTAFQTKISPQQQYQCQRMLERLRDKLEDANPRNTHSKLRKLERMLKWPLTSAETDETLREIERYKSTFNVALSMQSLEALLTAPSDQEDLAQDVKDIKNQLCRVQLDKERREVLKFFGTYESEPNHEMSVRLREPGTGLWLTHNSDVEAWLSDRNSKIWLYGIPGAGKTVLAGALITEALKLATPLVGIAYFYCDYKKATSRELTTLLASLAGQLATQNSACLEMLRKIYQPDKENVPLRSLPDASTLVQILFRFAQHFDEFVIIVDAIDECNDAQEIAHALRSLAECPVCKVAVLSREEQDIKHHLSCFTPVSVAANSSDLRLYVSSQLEERTRSRKLRIKSPQLKDDILQHLVDKADGM